MARRRGGRGGPAEPHWKKLRYESVGGKCVVRIQPFVSDNSADILVGMTQTTDTQGETRKLDCPKCKAAMETVTFQDIQIDRCTACKGLWFDALEKEHLDLLKGAESIDTGPAHVEKRDEVVRISCPVCHEPMIRMVDHQQPHIWYESCPVCYGMFFDAGEFREHKEHSVFGFFHDLFHRERK
jgi:Zn-finger nucleic acid-binding protein